MTSFLPPRRQKPCVTAAVEAGCPTGSLSVSAAAEGVAVGRDVSRSALGNHSQVFNVERQYVVAADTYVRWPVLVGRVPALASAFQPRTGLRRSVDDARGHGREVVLTSGDLQPTRPAQELQVPAQVMSGGGGVGKSQLAAAYAREALQDGTDLVLWTPATDPQQVLTAYAQAAHRVQVPGTTGTDMEADARAFLDWLAATDRRWLVVLDDITDAEAIEPWWPDSALGNGWTLATTRLKDPRLTGGGRTRIDVDVYTPAEAIDYLTMRLTNENAKHLLDEHAPALAQALGHLPLALGHAAAYMVRQEVSCARYLERFTDRLGRLDELLPDWADTERYGRQVTTTLLLTLDATDRDPLGSLARAALRVTAVLDPDGHPAAVWETIALTAYLTSQHTPDRGTAPFWRRRRRTPPTAVTGEQAREALHLLDRYGLITCSGHTGEHRAVRIHALTARSVREATTEEVQRTAVVAAADALVELWPDNDHTQGELAGVLRVNTEALSTSAHDALWTVTAHPVLHLMGISLLNAKLHSAALAYWRIMATETGLRTGTDHPDTLHVQANLAAAYRQAGRTSEAIALEKQVLADRERLQGSDHPDTLAARACLAVSYWLAGRTGEAIALEERVLADSERVLKPDHPDVLIARGNLAASYRQAGRTGEAIALEEQVLADRERLLEPDHPDTLTARASLAISYWLAGRTGEAIALEERVVADRERLLEPDHPDVLIARGNLAASYRQAGRTGEAIALEERVLADSERLLEPDHPDVVNARGHLAASYRQAGRTDEAIALEERVLADRERLQGSDHPHTLAARAALAVSYWLVGRTDEAIALEERVLADSERVLEPDHPDVITVRANLAVSYGQAGRTDEAIALEEWVLADRERLQGPDHPHTLTARHNLAASYRLAGRTEKAMALEEYSLGEQQNGRDR